MRQEGSFFTLSMILSKKKYNVIFLEGKRQSIDWNSLAERLRGLGVVQIRGLKETKVLDVPLRVKGGPKVLWREKVVGIKSYADAVKSSPGIVGDSVWLKVEEREVQGRLDQMIQCLVG